jgi:hypothetical protein
MTGLIIIPTRKKWQELKKKHQVADGAVSGVDLGKALDTYEAEAKTGIQFAKVNEAAAEKLEKVLATYISKLDPKKVKKDFNAFKKTFLDDYVGAAHAKKEDFKRYSADLGTYKKELASFFAAIQQLKPGETTSAELQKFKSGPVRGLSAVGSGLRAANVDLTQINAHAATIQQLIDGANGKSDQEVEQARVDIVEEAKHLAAAAHTQHLV